METPEKIQVPEKLDRLSMSKKFIIKLNSFLKVKVIPYAVSSVIGVGVGGLVQKKERDYTGYSPEYHELLKQDLAHIKQDNYLAHKQEETLSKKEKILKWFSDVGKNIKEGVLNPKEFIQSSEMYKTLQLQLLDNVKMLDDGVMYCSALLTFIMLGGYLSRKLEKIEGDAIDKEEKERMRIKINEIVDWAEVVTKRIESDFVSVQEFNEIKDTMIILSKTLPDDM